LLPNFTAKSGSFDTCTPSDPGGSHQVSPSKPDTPDTPDTPHDDDDDDDHDDDHDDDVGERSPFCGPENPGTYGEITSVSKSNVPGADTDVCRKHDKNNDTWSNLSGCKTKKYTTKNANPGRTYYRFRQKNKNWSEKVTGSGSYFGDMGCKRTSFATVLTGFGVSVSPLNFIKSQSYNSWITKAHLELKTLSNRDSDDTILDAIWETLSEKGGAAVIRLGTKPYTNGDSHYIPLVDYRIEGGKKQVYILNSVPGSNTNGWHNLDNFRGKIRRASDNPAFLFIPKDDIKNVKCNVTGDDSDPGGGGGDGGTDTPDINSIGKGDACGPETPSRSTGVSLVSPSSSMDKKVYGSLTRKYTTTKNRVYYVYRQDDEPWKDASAGGSNKMKDEGESRTLIADIMRSFGAEVTPLHFSGTGISGKAAAISRAESLISMLKLPLIGGIQKFTSNYENVIKTTLNGGGAVLVKVEGGIFNHKKGATHIALIDIKEVDGKTRVFLIDSFGRTKASKNDKVPVNNWVDLDVVVDSSTGIKEIHTFVSKGTACQPANNVPYEYQ
jgi:hypothetical protein